MSINTEDLVSSLLFIGYDKVDSALFTNARIAIANKFKFEDHSISKFFSSPIEFNGISFKLKEGLTSTSIILNRNKELTNYLISEGFGIFKHQILDKAKTLVKSNS